VAKRTAVVEQAAEVVEQIEATPAARVKLCGCGQCGLEVKPGRQFRQGHDARRRSILIEFLEEGQGAMAEELIERGWMSQAEWDERLGRRIDQRAAKAEKTEAAAVRKAQREQAKQQRAAARGARAQARASQAPAPEVPAVESEAA
jgi:hypothetical protein